MAEGNVVKTANSPTIPASEKVKTLKSLLKGVKFDGAKLKKAVGIFRISNLYTESVWTILVEKSGSDEPEKVKEWIIANYPK